MNDSLVNKEEGELAVGCENEASDVSEQPNEEIVAEKPNAEMPEVDEAGSGDMPPKGDDTKQDMPVELKGDRELRMDEEKVVSERARKGKAKAPPPSKKKKTAAVQRRERADGPVIREPVDIGQRGAVESSESSEDDYEQPASYGKYATTIDEETVVAIKKFSDPKMKQHLKFRKQEVKAYSSGHVVDIDSLTKLGVFSRVGESMKKIGCVWLLALQDDRVPKILCDEFITSFEFKNTTNLTTPSIPFRLFGE